MWQFEFLQKKLIKGALVAILIILFFSLNTDVEGVPSEKQITVVFRFDDYSSLSPTEFEVKLINTFRKYNVACTFGVIPCVCAGDCHEICPQEVVPLALEKSDILKNAIKEKILEVALHGYSHQTFRKKEDFGYTEFEGLDVNSQVQKITRGKDYLEDMLGTKITSFIPPWNSFDSNTIQALEILGFSVLSADNSIELKRSTTLKLVPATCSLVQLRQTVGLARCVSEKQPVIVVMFHKYDFIENDKEKGELSYNEFQALMTWITSQQDIRIRTIGQTATLLNNMDDLRFKNNFSLLLLSSLVPPLQSLYHNLLPTEVYLSSSTAKNMKSRCILFLFLIYLSLFVVSVVSAFFTSTIIFPKSRLAVIASLSGGLAVAILPAIYTIHDSHVGYKGVTILVIFLGMYIGWLCYFFKLKKQRQPHMT